MNTLKLKTNAKINLTLDVLSRRENGYHNVSMIMQSIDLSDDISVSLDKEGIELSTNLPYLPCDSRNIAYKAAQYFLHHFNIKNIGVKIYIEKNIPIAAGIAGGSSNAAGVIKALDLLFKTNMTLKEQMEFGFLLGADVPFSIMGGTAHATGIGNILNPLPSMPEVTLVVAKPKLGLSTKWVYKNLQINKIKRHPDTLSMIEAIKSGNVYDISGHLYNVLEEGVSKKHPVIKKMRQTMKKCGCLGSVMSGSGPTVFGIFDDWERAEYAQKMLNKYIPFVTITKTL